MKYRRQGRYEAGRELILKLLWRKFGSMTQATFERVITASEDDIDRFVERIIPMESLEDVLR